MPGCAKNLGVETHIALQFIFLIKVEEILLNFGAICKKCGPIWVWLEGEIVLMGRYITPDLFQPVLAGLIFGVQPWKKDIRNTRICVLKPRSANLCISESNVRFC